MTGPPLTDAFPVFLTPVVVRVLRPPLALAGGPAGFAALIFPAVVLVVGIAGIGQEPFAAVAAFPAVESHLGVLRVDYDTEDTLQAGTGYAGRDDQRQKIAWAAVLHGGSWPTARASASVKEPVGATGGRSDCRNGWHGSCQGA